MRAFSIVFSSLILSAGLAYGAEDRMAPSPAGRSRGVLPQALPAMEKKQTDPQGPQRVPFPSRVVGESDLWSFEFK
jgi:hypothetical protein